MAIKKPKIGMKVIVNNRKCCLSFHKKGTIGTIEKIDNIDSFTVREKDGDYWWHCRECVDEVN